ncbi:MAG: hypothetical protein MEQ84_07630 [Mesorhizobium sp.]|nr:hypothetical protein [Mesorhizobium sp.]
MTIRFPIQPRMVPPEKIARRLGVTVAVFNEKLAALEANGFPKRDPVLGNYCLQAVDNWIDARAGLHPAGIPVSDPAVVLEMAGSRAWRR